MTAITPAATMLRRSSRVVAVQPWLVERFGAPAAIWFSQLMWCMEDTGHDTIVKSDGEWLAETGMGAEAVRRARTKMLEAGWITCTVRKNHGTPTTHTTLALEVIEVECRRMDSSKSTKPGNVEIDESSLSLEVRDIESADSSALHAKQGTKQKRTRGLTTAPDSLEITDAMTEWARVNEVEVDLDEETEQFLDYHRAKGSTFKDWGAAWKGWMRRSKTYSGRGRPRADLNGFGGTYEVT